MAGGTVHGGSSARFPTKPTEKLKIEKMYAIKQIKICAEYRDMLPRPRLDLSGTPGLRPIGLSPGSWQTSLGLGSMSRYSAQILICITKYDFSHRLLRKMKMCCRITILYYKFGKRFTHTPVDNKSYFSRGQIHPGLVKSLPRSLNRRRIGLNRRRIGRLQIHSGQPVDGRFAPVGRRPECKKT